MKELAGRSISCRKYGIYIYFDMHYNDYGVTRRIKMIQNKVKHYNAKLWIFGDKIQKKMKEFSILLILFG